MKYAITAAVASLATLSNAYLTYNPQTKAISCPIAAGSYCLAPGSPVIVKCANSIGTLSACATGQTCSQTGPNTGDAKCSTTPSNSTGTPIYDSAASECNCEGPSSSSAHPILPSTYSMRPWTVSTTFVPPAVMSTTPVSPAQVSTTSMTSQGGSSGIPQPTTRATTLNSSSKPTLASTASSAPSSTIAAPVQQTRNAAVGHSANAIAALGAAGLLAALL